MELPYLRAGTWYIFMCTAVHLVLLLLCIYVHVHEYPRLRDEVLLYIPAARLYIYVYAQESKTHSAKVQDMGKAFQNAPTFLGPKNKTI